MENVVQSAVQRIFPILILDKTAPFFTHSHASLRKYIFVGLLSEFHVESKEN